MLTGLQARAAVSRDALLADLMQEHLTNGVKICTGETYKNVVKMTFSKGASCGSGRRDGREARLPSWI